MESLYLSQGYFTVQSTNGVTSLSLHHFPILSTTEADGMHVNASSVVPAPNLYPVSQQRESSNMIREGCAFNMQNEILNLHITPQHHQPIIQQDAALKETQLHFHASTSQHQVLQPKLGNTSSQILQLKCGKKFKQDGSRCPDSRLPERTGWCSLCEVHCKTEVVLKDHNSGKKDKRMLKKLQEGSGDRRDGDSKEQKPQTEKQRQGRDRRHGDSKQQKLQIKKQQQEREIIENLEKNEKQVKEEGIPSKKRKRSSNTNKFTDECKICDKVFISQAYLESHLAGKKHAKQLKIMEKSIASSEVKGGSKKCAVADGNKLINIKSALLAEDDEEKRANASHVRKVKHDKNLGAKCDKFDMKAYAELNEQQQMKGAGMSSKKRKISKKSCQLSIEECKICDKLFYGQFDFESHVTGRKHIKRLKKMGNSITISEIKGDSKECANVDAKESGSSDYGAQVKDNVDKANEEKTILQFKDDGGLGANSDEDVLKVSVEIKEIDSKNVDLPDGNDKKLEEKVRNDKEDEETDHYDSKEDNKSDSKEYVNADLKESEGFDTGPLVKDDVDKTVEDITILEFKDDGISGANSEKDDVKGSAEFKEIDGGKIAEPDRNDKEDEETDYHDSKEDDKGDSMEFVNADLKESEGFDGSNKKLEEKLRNDKEDEETDRYDSKEDDKGDSKEYVNADLKESEGFDTGPLVKDDVDKTVVDITILDLKDDGCSGANSEKDDLKESAELKEVDGEKIAETKRNDKEHEETEHHDSKDDNKGDSMEFVNADLKKSEGFDYDPVVKDDVDKTVEDTTIFEFKDDGGPGAKSEKDDLKESTELKKIAKPARKDDQHEEEEELIFDSVEPGKRKKDLADISLESM